MKRGFHGGAQNLSTTSTRSVTPKIENSIDRTLDLKDRNGKRVYSHALVLTQAFQAKNEDGEIVKKFAGSGHAIPDGVCTTVAFVLNEPPAVGTHMKRFDVANYKYCRNFDDNMTKIDKVATDLKNKNFDWAAYKKQQDVKTADKSFTKHDKVKPHSFHADLFKVSMKENEDSTDVPLFSQATLPSLRHEL